MSRLCKDPNRERTRHTEIEILQKKTDDYKRRSEEAECKLRAALLALDEQKKLKKPESVAEKQTQTALAVDSQSELAKLNKKIEMLQTENKSLHNSYNSNLEELMNLKIGKISL
jgi:hypothetical protein